MEVGRNTKYFKPDILDVKLESNISHNFEDAVKLGVSFQDFLYMHLKCLDEMDAHLIHTTMVSKSDTITHQQSSAHAVHNLLDDQMQTAVMSDKSFQHVPVLRCIGSNACTGSSTHKVTNFAARIGRCIFHEVLKFLIKLVFSVIMLYILCWVSSASFSADVILDDIWYSPCILETNFAVQEMTRPITDCNMCMNIQNIDTTHSLKKEEFVEKYAYTGVPVLAKGAALNWPAVHNFSFNFFKEIYGNLTDMDDHQKHCQFFNYKTEFRSLKEVLEMSEARAKFDEGQRPWYIGWSNCHPTVSEVFRHQYTRPDFLPTDSENSALDWLFMGGFGPGAQIHIDYVQRPSWQAQISGAKKWNLLPPPECDTKCKPLKVTVEKGDIFCMNTNEWYHDTYIIEGDISITIGSEYD